MAGIFGLNNLTSCALISAFQSGPGPSNASYKDGLLAVCPQSPNCVSTQSLKADKHIVPFTYSFPIDQAKTSLKSQLAQIENMILVFEDGNYLHYESRSRVFRFVDDVEFIFNDESKTVQFRSSSRVGYSDWGVNRKRMESIRNNILGRI